MMVRIDKRAIKDLSKLDKKEAQKILLKIDTLENFPNVVNCKKLTNFEPPFRLRVGNYRVLFDIVDNNIVVYRVRDRKESY